MEQYEIDDLYRMLLEDTSWEADAEMRDAVVQTLHFTYVGTPLE